MFQFLVRTGDNRLFYILKATAWTLGSALLISLLLARVATPEQMSPIDGTETMTSVGRVVFFLGVVIVSPWVETVLMWPVLALFKRILPNDFWVVMASASVWALLHSASAPLWGVAIFIPFAIFSTIFLTWQRKSNVDAIVMTAGVHMLHNLLPALSLILDA